MNLVTDCVPFTIYSRNRNFNTNNKNDNISKTIIIVRLDVQLLTKINLLSPEEKKDTKNKVLTN